MKTLNPVTLLNGLIEKISRNYTTQTDDDNVLKHHLRETYSLVRQWEQAYERTAYENKVSHIHSAAKAVGYDQYRYPENFVLSISEKLGTHTIMAEVPDSPLEWLFLYVSDQGEALQNATYFAEEVTFMQVVGWLLQPIEALDYNYPGVIDSLEVFYNRMVKLDGVDPLYSLELLYKYRAQVSELEDISPAYEQFITMKLEQLIDEAFNMGDSGDLIDLPLSFMKEILTPVPETEVP